jgi:hypothetical protein
MADLAKFVVFKPVVGGYVYRTPNAWGFRPGRHYLVNDHQKAEILRTIASSSRRLLWVTGISWMTLSVLLGTVVLTWVDRANQRRLPGSLLAVDHPLAGIAGKGARPGSELRLRFGKVHRLSDAAGGKRAKPAGDNDPQHRLAAIHRAVSSGRVRNGRGRRSTPPRSGETGRMSGAASRAGRWQRVRSRSRRYSAPGPSCTIGRCRH